MNSLFKLGAAVTIALATGGAFAASNTIKQDFGVLVLPYTQGVSDSFAAMTPAPSGSWNFYDDYLFTLPASSGSLTGSVVSVDLTSLLGIDNLQARIYQINSSADLTTGKPAMPVADAWSTAINSNGFNATLLTFTSPTPLSANAEYAFEVRGNVTGTFGGSYGANINISPVPEASGWTLGLAGLGMLGFASRRRRA